MPKESLEIPGRFLVGAIAEKIVDEAVRDRRLCPARQAAHSCAATGAAVTVLRLRKFVDAMLDDLSILKGDMENEKSLEPDSLQKHEDKIESQIDRTQILLRERVFDLFAELPGSADIYANWNVLGKGLNELARIIRETSGPISDLPPVERRRWIGQLLRFDLPKLIGKLSDDLGKQRSRINNILRDLRDDWDQNKKDIRGGQGNPSPCTPPGKSP